MEIRFYPIDICGVFEFPNVLINCFERLFNDVFYHFAYVSEHYDSLGVFKIVMRKENHGQRRIWRDSFII